MIDSLERRLLDKLIRQNPQAALKVTRRIAQDGNPFPLVELLFGKLLTLEELLSCREEWESGQRGPWLILDPWQKLLLESVFDPSVREIDVKGNTGCGKGAGAAMAIVAYYVAFSDAKVVITRDTADTAIKLAFGEVVKWWNKAVANGIPLVSRVNDGGSIYTSPSQHFIRTANPNTDEGFSGCHGDHVFFWFDEGTAVPKPRWDMAETQVTTLLVTANPRQVVGPFRDRFKVADPNKNQRFWTPSGNRVLITIGGDQCANVRAGCLAKAVAPPGGITVAGAEYREGQTIPLPVWKQYLRPIVPGQVTLDQYLGLKAHPDKRFAKMMADGHFPDSDPEKTIFFRERIEKSNRKHNRWLRLWRIAHGQEAMNPAQWWIKKHYRNVKRMLQAIIPIEAGGLDVGGSTAGDPSVLAIGGRRGCRFMYETQEKSTTSVVDWAVRMLAENGIDDIDGFPLGVDAVGVGLGVVDVARRRGFHVVECFGGAVAEDSKLYYCRRAERFCQFGHRLNPDGYYPYDLAGKEGGANIFALPESDELIEELLAHEKLVAGMEEKINVTPKKSEKGEGDIFSRLGRSPDRADAVSYLFETLDRTADSLRNWLAVISAAEGEIRGNAAPNNVDAWLGGR